MPAVEEEPEFGELELVEPEFDEPELDDPVSDEAELDPPEVDDPAFALPDPGRFPQGDPLGVVPGAAEVFGFAVDGCILPADEAGFVGFEPGVPGGGGTEPVGGAVGLLVGGGGVVEGVVPLGVWLCRADAELPAVELPPAGALWATTQVAQKRSMATNVSFLVDIG